MASGALDPEQARDAVARFHRRHHELCNFSMNFRAVEFLNFRVKATARRASFALEEIPAVTGNPEGALKRRRSAIFDGKRFKLPVYDGDRVRAGNVVEGPAIIEERTTTVVVPPSFDCAVDRFKSDVLTTHHKEDRP